MKACSSINFGQLDCQGISIPPKKSILFQLHGHQKIHTRNTRQQQNASIKGVIILPKANSDDVTSLRRSKTT